MIADSARSPCSSGSYQASSSPPSPVFEAAPRRRIAIAIVRCASGDRAPRLIADETKRAVIASTGSTAADAERPVRGSDREEIADQAGLGPLEGGPVGRQPRRQPVHRRPREGLDRLHPGRREEVDLALGSEPGKARVLE